ncbi:hypothetical protein RJ55_07479 [Drechmeria coniospora]|nr:hypothetical protein RJ55_07479 [Drechmeria coniospora]
MDRIARSGWLRSPVHHTCHKDRPEYDAARCAEISKKWVTFDWHTQDPVSNCWSQFSNDTCLPDGPSCSGQGYPPFVVNATTARHVKAGIDFGNDLIDPTARKYNVRLLVKGTGHDDNGRSIAPGALSIWTHHMKEIEYHASEFRLAGSGRCIQGSAVTVGAGNQMYDIYVATARYNKTIVGGGGKSVGVGGYLSGGGHSILGARYGLGADNVLEMQLVTPGGDIVTANEDQHSDLFWAMRGGGGSTFGAMTSVTLKAHPSPSIAYITWYAYMSADSPVAFDLVGYVLSQFPTLMDEGVSGYQYIFDKMPNPLPGDGQPKVISGLIGGFMLQDVTDATKLEALLKPVEDAIGRRWNGTAHIVKETKLYASFLDWFDVNYDQGVAGGNVYRTSRLVDRKALTGDPKALGEAYRAATKAAGAVTAYMVAGKAVQKARPRGGGNAVNPAWRQAYLQSLTGVTYPSFNQTAERTTIEALDVTLDPLKALTPTMGAYINEGWLFEKDWQKTFWGSNYARLHRIKKQVDPTNVFVCFPCVGSEGWFQRDDGRLCRR